MSEMHFISGIDFVNIYAGGLSHFRRGIFEA